MNHLETGIIGIVIVAACGYLIRLYRKKWSNSSGNCGGNCSCSTKITEDQNKVN
ncbi:MAG TPA: FeoB-associated Cys-rich membrane protein [Verrucomicrobiales bacterium]|jgi:hypothetical protein|nr:FeoB-associated Cys-rich membrane protein [Verrucomicrobiales bacterium]HIL72161.1 FeoB-associated Cys-rich membrane protein [Verrucomicrobiota bacterium]